MASVLTEFTIAAPEEGIRLDLFLQQQKSDLTRSKIKKLIDDGHVLVNSQLTKAGKRLRCGDKIEVTIPPVKPSTVVPEDIPLNIIYEDEDIIVINKSAGMVVHPAQGNYSGTLVNAVLYHCKTLSGIGGVLRPGIVHRLDKDTSGILVIAKNDKSHLELSRQFKEREIKRRYYALAYGLFKEEHGEVEKPIGRDPYQRKRMSVKSLRGKRALTYWNVIERFDKVALLAIQLASGRTHQIRVHLAHIGHPIIGDKVYGGATKILRTIPNTAVLSALKDMKRQALHAFFLGFIHPATGKYVEFESSLPEDMAPVIENLRKITHE